MRLFLYVIVMISAFGCKTDEQLLDDKKYNEFKSAIQKDSMSVSAISTAQYIVEYHDDSSKRREAAIWLQKMNAYLANSSDVFGVTERDEEAFMLKVLAPARSFILKQDSISMVVHLIAQPITQNADSLKRALKKVTNDYFIAIPYYDKCKQKVRCEVYVYYPMENGKDPVQGNCFGMGTRITGEEAKVLLKISKSK